MTDATTPQRAKIGTQPVLYRAGFVEMTDGRQAAPVRDALPLYPTVSARLREVIKSARHTARMDVDAVLADLAGLGPYFAVATGIEPGDRPVADLHADPGPVRARIAHVRRALDCEERVAASLAFQGLAAQLTSAPYAAAVLHGMVPALTPAVLHWRRADDGGWRLRCDPRGVALLDADELPSLLAELLVPLVAAVRAQVSIAEQLLWGNAASTVAAAKRLVAVQRPDAARRAADVAQGVLGTGPMAGAGELLPPRDPDRHWTFRRRSCCLYYRVPGSGGLCDDCVLAARPGGDRPDP